jgi:hypothetical protein
LIGYDLQLVPEEADQTFAAICFGEPEIDWPEALSTLLRMIQVEDHIQLACDILYITAMFLISEMRVHSLLDVKG